VVSFLLPGIGIILTIFRLTVRTRTKRLGWDDFTAFVACLAMILLVIATIFYTTPPETHSQSVKTAFFYLTAESYYFVIWFSRTSILLSIIRIVPGPRMQRILWSIGGMFAAVLAALTIQMFAICQNQPGWRDSPTPQCSLGIAVAMTQLACESFSPHLSRTAS
jgi:hypothetical protein